jgi:hypothetical protein
VKQPVVGGERVAEPEVDHANVHVSVKQHVLRLQVAVHNSLLFVEVLHNTHQLAEQAPRLDLWHAIAGVDEVEGRAALGEFLHNECLVVGSDHFEDVRNEWMAKLLGDRHLTDKPRLKIGCRHGRVVHRLQRNFHGR